MKRQNIVVVLIVGSAGLFVAILENIVTRGWLVQVDHTVYLFLQGLRSAPIDTIMVGITEWGDSIVVFVLAVVICLWLLSRRAWRAAAYWAATVGGAAAINTGLKFVIQRQRPVSNLYEGVSAYSFPSGHVTSNAAMYGFLAFLVVRQIGQPWRAVAMSATAIVVAPVAFSRLYLGAHWFSDVIGSLTLAFAWVLLLVALYSRRSPPQLPVWRLAVVAGVVLTVVGSAHIAVRHGEDIQRYAPPSPLRAVPAATTANHRNSAAAYGAHGHRIITLSS